MVTVVRSMNLPMPKKMTFPCGVAPEMVTVDVFTVIVSVGAGSARILIAAQRMTAMNAEMLRELANVSSDAWG